MILICFVRNGIVECMRIIATNVITGANGRGHCGNIEKSQFDL